MPTYIVIGLTSQGLALLRLLSRAGHQVVAFSSNKSAVGLYSRYGKKITYSSIHDLKTKIEYIASYSKNKPKCIIASGEALALILDEYPELYDICAVESGPRGIVSILSHKDKMYDLARSIGLNCADYKVLAKHSPGELSYPIILKKNYESFPLFKVKKISSDTEFESLYQRIPQVHHDDVIVQRFVKFDIRKHITYQCYVSEGNRYCEFIGLQTRKTDSGLTSFLEEMKPSALRDEIIQLSTKLLTDLPYSGFIEIEYAVELGTGIIFFMEANTRVCGTFSALVYKYSNLSELFTRNLSSLPKNYDFGKTAQPIKWVNLARDINTRIKNRDFRSLWHILYSHKDICDWLDPLPFLMQFIRR